MLVCKKGKEFLMYIVRWLMGHPIIATWVLGAIALLLTFGSGKKDQIIDVQGEKPVAVLENQDINIDAPVVSVESIEKQSLKKADTSKPETADQDQIEGKMVLEEDAVGVTKKTNTVTISTKNTEKPVVKNSNVDDATKEVSQKTSEPSTVIISEGNKKPELLNATTDLNQSSTEELLQMAREAYWNNGLDEAAEIYQRLIELEPKVIEHRGELGNVLWRQGYPKKAAELYSEIAIPMIDGGNPERVANMVGFIGLFFPDRAAVIHQRIQAVNGQ